MAEPTIPRTHRAVDSTRAESETDLVRRWRDGDARAGDRLVRIYDARLHAYFRRRFSGDVGDLVQRTWLAITHAKARFRFECKFERYCLATARYIGFEEIRRRCRATPSTDTAIAMMAKMDDPFTMLERSQTYARLALAMHELGARDSEVVLPFYWDGCGAPALSRALGIPEPSVRSRLRRARERLATTMAETSIHSRAKPGT